MREYTEFFFFISKKKQENCIKLRKLKTKIINKNNIVIN